MAPEHSPPFLKEKDKAEFLCEPGKFPERVKDKTFCRSETSWWIWLIVSFIAIVILAIVIRYICMKTFRRKARSEISLSDIPTYANNPSYHMEHNDRDSRDDPNTSGRRQTNSYGRGDPPPPYKTQEQTIEIVNPEVDVSTE